MSLLARAADKTGSLGSIVSAMSCAGCFPALANLGAALGLGFLGRYAGLFIDVLLPLFATVALLANALGWLAHRQWRRRTALGMVGPSIVLVARYPLRDFSWSAYMVYAGLAMMVAVSIWDLRYPAHRRCSPNGCELPPTRG